MVKYALATGTQSDTVKFDTPMMDHVAEQLNHVANETSEANRLKRIELQMIPILRQIEKTKDNTSMQILIEKLMILSAEASEDKA